MRSYDPHAKKWAKYCVENKVNVKKPNEIQVLTFLQTIVERNLSYSSVNTARSALNSFATLPDGTKFRNNDNISLFMLGAFNKNPPQARCSATWDPDVVLNGFRKGQAPEDLPSELLVKRLAFLILILSGQRPQLLQSLTLDNVTIDSSQVVFKVGVTHFKQGRPGYKAPLIVLKRFPDERVCVVTHLEVYLKRTRSLRGEIDKLFITSRKPFRAATRDTTSRWVKDILRASGINTELFGAGSTRAAAASKIKQQGANIEDIIKLAGWSRSSTFAKFYAKTVCEENVADLLLYNSKQGD